MKLHKAGTFAAETQVSKTIRRMAKRKLWSTEPARTNKFYHHLSILQNDDFKNFSTMYVTVITPETTLLYIKYIGKEGSELLTGFSRKIKLHIWIGTDPYCLPRKVKHVILKKSICWYSIGPCP